MEKEGNWVYKRGNGQLWMTGQYLNGKEHGLWNYYDHRSGKIYKSELCKKEDVNDIEIFVHYLKF